MTTKPNVLLVWLVAVVLLALASSAPASTRFATLPDCPHLYDAAGHESDAVDTLCEAPQKDLVAGHDGLYDAGMYLSAGVVEARAERGWRNVPGGTFRAARQLPFAEGDVIFREFQSSRGLLDVAAEVRIQGGTLHLKDIAVYPRGAESLTLGPREVLTLRNQLAREAADLGFDQLRITGTRLTGANPGKQPDMLIDLTKYR